MFETIKKALQRPEEPTFLIVQPGGDYSKLPVGFFESVGGQQKQIGFHCPKCRFTLRYGAQNGVTHCGQSEMPPPAEAGPLTQVHWDYSAMRAGATGEIANVGGNRVVDTDKMPGSTSGDISYDGSHPSRKITDYDLGDTAINSGLWGGGHR